MSYKPFYALFLAAVFASVSGCSNITTTNENNYAKTNIETLGTESLPSSRTTETKVNHDIGDNDSYPANHSLDDGSITFTDDVAVLIYDELTSYDPDSYCLTVSKDVDLTGCKYAYVTYTDAGDYLFQKIVKTSDTDDGGTAVTLSGLPLEKELDKKEFLSLITDINLYGDEKGDASDAFKQNKNANKNIP